MSTITMTDGTNIHGDDDQIVPLAASAEKTSKLVKDATYKV